MTIGIISEGKRQIRYKMTCANIKLTKNQYSEYIKTPTNQQEKYNNLMQK